MSSKRPVVSARGAKFGKVLMGLGGFQVDFHCPNCKRELTSKDDAIAIGDECPFCKAVFDFDGEITNAYAAFANEKKSREESRLAAEAEKQKRRQTKEEEQARRSQEERRRRDEEWAETEKRLNAARRSQQESNDNEARNIDGAYGFLNAILIMAGLGVLVTLAAAFIFLGNSNSLNSNEEIGRSLFILGVTSAVSLTLVFVLFRTLKAIHSVLVMILDRLESSSD